MMIRMNSVKRAVKYLGAGVAGVGALYLIKQNDLEMSTIGVARFGRAAFAVNF